MLDIAKIQTLQVTKGKSLLCQPCLNIVLFGLNVSQSADLTQPISVFADHFGGELKWQRSAADQEHARRIPDVPALVDRTLDEWRSLRKHMAYIELSSGPGKQAWAAPFLEQCQTPYAGHVFTRVALPIEWLSTHGASGLEAFISDLTMGLGGVFRFGYVGLGALWCRASVEAPRVLWPFFAKWAWLYPGLTASDPLGQLYPAEQGLVDVGWITLLGGEMAARMGGTAELVKTLSSTANNWPMVKALPSGLTWIQAGEAPDLNGPSVSTQHKVGAVLSSLCDPAQNANVVMPGFERPDEEGLLARWANRFFTPEAHA